jgi:sulfonate transport system permease protein
MALVAVELLAASEGVGFLMVHSRQLFQLDMVMASMVVIGVTGWLLDRILQIVERRLLAWRVTAY